jgi:branched-chain amino acid aminotransferase
MDLPKHAYFHGRIVPYSEAKVGVATHALNYGTAVFSGIRGYWNKEQKQLFVFRPMDHFRRFLNSCRMICIDFNFTPEDLTKLTLELLRADDYQQDIYIRPLAYKSDELIGVRLHDLTDELTIFAMPMEKYAKHETDASVTISSWRRVDDNIIPARGKISGAYINSALAKTDAARGGYDEALVLNQDGHLAEGSAMNIFIVRDGVLLTPPVTENILEGITRRTVMELAKKELGLTVVERPIDRSEIYVCDELILTGTAAEVMAVTQVDHRPVGCGQMGPVAAGLRDLYAGVVRGEHPCYCHWNIPVY